MDNNSVSNPLTNIGRVHYLDQIRALALLTGILMHACYSYGYLKLPISLAILFFIGLITYRYMVLYTFIGTLLNGKRGMGI